LFDKLDEARQGLSPDDCGELAIDLAREDLENLIRRYIDEHLGETLVVLDVLWEKYGISQKAIVNARDSAAVQVANFVKELGYV
jgi:hypothetical protein